MKKYKLLSLTILLLLTLSGCSSDTEYSNFTFKSTGLNNRNNKRSNVSASNIENQVLEELRKDYDTFDVELDVSNKIFILTPTSENFVKSIAKAVDGNSASLEVWEYLVYYFRETSVKICKELDDKDYAIVVKSPVANKAFLSLLNGYILYNVTDEK